MSAAASIDDLDARRLIETLGLAPHPEGGFYRETFRDGLQVAPGRAASTAIYFLLEAGRASAWHRIDAAEIWLFHAGAPLLLSLSADGRTTTDQRLGSDILAGERPQAVVSAHCWQAARTLGAWTLVSCVVAPGFDFAKFELAPRGFRAWRFRSMKFRAAGGGRLAASPARRELSLGKQTHNIVLTPNLHIDANMRDNVGLSNS